LGPVIVGGNNEEHSSCSSSLRHSLCRIFKQHKKLRATLTHYVHKENVLYF